MKIRSSTILNVMRKLAEEEKELQAMVVYSACSEKTRNKIRSMLKVKTKLGVMNKISPKHKTNKT